MNGAADSDARTGLPIALAAALAITACAVVLGPVRYLRQGGGPWVHIVPLSFQFWETHDVRAHYFLSFFDADALAHQRAYTHYTQPWLLTLYILLQPARWAGVSYESAQPWLCLPQFAVIVWLVAAHCRTVGRATLMPIVSLAHVRLAAIALAIACVLTLPSFWVPFFRFNPEQIWFVPALAFSHLAAADFRRAVGRRADWAALLAIALFAPMFAPFAIVSWLVLWELDGAVSRRRMATLTAIGALAALAFLLPGWLRHFTALTPGGSSIWYRSGLDGSDRYFSSIMQAVLQPYYARPWQVLQWPITALAVIAVAAARSRALAARMARQLFIAWLPLLWTVTVVPQMVSIHPYSFDLTLALGGAFCLAFWLQLDECEAWIRFPALRLAILIAFTGLLMTNLIDLARLGATAA